MSGTTLRPVKERLPDGKYEAIWSGYDVTVVHKGIEHKYKAQIGVRTPVAKCVVTIVKGEAKVSFR